MSGGLNMVLVPLVDMFEVVGRAADGEVGTGGGLDEGVDAKLMNCGRGSDLRAVSVDRRKFGLDVRLGGCLA